MKNKMFAVPMNLGANKAGIDFGPEVLEEKFPEVFGNMELIEVEKKREDFNEQSLKYKNTILHTCEKLAVAVNDAVKTGYRPIVIGGDHSIALGSISGVAKEKTNLGVVWIDAHGDMNTHESTESGHIHGMPLASLQGLGDKDLAKCFFDGAKIKSENVVILGARDIDKKELELIEKYGIKMINYTEVLEKGLDRILSEIKDYLKVTDLHISFDVDSIDPEFAPGVSTPVRSGFSPEEMFKTFEFLFNSYDISSVDIVEYNPVNDKSEKTMNFVNELTEFVLNPKK